MILILAGTKDGRLLAGELTAAGYPVLASSVSQYGGSLLQGETGGEVRTGPLNEEELVNLIRERGIRMVIDATHPFAVQVRQNARQACEQTQVPRLRFERERVEEEAGASIIQVSHISEAIRSAASFPGNIFLTTGSSTVEAFVQHLGPGRLIVRLLPDPAALQRCAFLGMGPDQLIAMQGPFSTEMNREMFRHFKATVVVSKESGRTGGLPEKIEAAAQLSIPLILINRPSLTEESLVFSNHDELIEHVRLNYLAGG